MYHFEEGSVTSRARLSLVDRAPGATTIWPRRKLNLVEMINTRLGCGKVVVDLLTCGGKAEVIQQMSTM